MGVPLSISHVSFIDKLSDMWDLSRRCDNNIKDLF